MYFFILHLRYVRKKNKVQKVGGRKKIVFFVSQQQLWNSETLYEILSNDAGFVVQIVAFPNHEAGERNLVSSCVETYNFFKNAGKDVIFGYNIEQANYISMDEINADVVFFDQPFQNLPKHLLLSEVSKRALTCYIPYGFKISPLGKWNFDTDFHNGLWKIFAESEWHKKQFQEMGLWRGRNVFVAGYPKLDIYNREGSVSLKDLWGCEDDNAKRVIWAPHWSIGKNVLNYSTFETNHKYMFELAQRDKNINWIVRPHQRLVYELVNTGVMDEAQVKSYFDGWDALSNGKVCWDGDYFDIFKTSDALITDCGSFLAEYLLTGKPILHLINQRSQGYNEIGKIITGSLYKIKTLQELKECFHKVVVLGIDEKYQDRMDALRVVPINKDGAGKCIFNYLKTALNAKG